MKFAAAFCALGYKLGNQRQDWSAEKSDGVCISLWTKETDWNLLVMDTRIHAQDLSVWGHKPGNRKRASHAERAVREFDGWIDVVKIDGTPGVGYGTASPWIPSDRDDYRWRVMFVEQISGHIRLEAHKPG